ncbi:MULTISPECIES: hypothetical protein [Brevibacillus]|jgi:hypothetical protein|uniref:J domain-containing protein n=1 Tax=Brevibacillus aydinogluensis TaxID=927786 RepID=A0AA48M531_9BACL|nr:MULTISPECIES: hypothetical protein [Brevibacillus]MBR8661684.1 hypothetical protein [Brevibacillus sp. NL20B1]MDT3415850.1 hypothetical protein [Brevibacillus aydinogluensis]NNV03932.1 hypothetical protein [Brevibacillus sp. MCWH]CAJ1001414.1 J domain-containing protein [Brevibacillus aydinogluensis]
MKTSDPDQVVRSAPSREALRTAYELILTRIWPRMAARQSPSDGASSNAPPPSSSIGRSMVHEDSTDTERTDHPD